MSTAVNLRNPAPALFDAWARGLIDASKATPYFHLEGYMERFWIQMPPGLQEPDATSDRWKTGNGARIHHILRSDNDRHLHDHPWPSTSLILFEGYLEVLPKDQRQDPRLDSDPEHQIVIPRAPGDVIHRAAGDRHRLIVNRGRTAWTLFMIGDYEQGWGFYTPEGKVPWREYLGVV